MRTYLCGQWTKVNTIKLSKVFQLAHFTPIKLNFKGSTKTHSHHICNLYLLHSFIQDPVYYVLCNICAFCHHHKLKMTSPHCTAPTPSSEASEARSPLWRRRRWGGWGRWQPSWPSLWWWCLYPLTTPSTPPPWPPQSQNSCFQAATCNSFFTDLIGNCWESSLSKYRSPWWRKPHKSTWLCPQILYDLKNKTRVWLVNFLLWKDSLATNIWKRCQNSLGHWWHVLGDLSSDCLADSASTVTKKHAWQPILIMSEENNFAS